LATLYNSTGGVRIDAISEGNDAGVATTLNGYIVTGVDAGSSTPTTIAIDTTPNPADEDKRFGNEAGGDYYFNASNLNDANNGKLFNIQGNDGELEGFAIINELATPTTDRLAAFSILTATAFLLSRLPFFCLFDRLLFISHALYFSNK
jgi:hypothetical protein